MATCAANLSLAPYGGPQLIRSHKSPKNIRLRTYEAKDPHPTGNSGAALHDCLRTDGRFAPSELQAFSLS